MLDQMTGTLLPEAAMDRLMPMHLMLNAEGMIVHCGPTLAKLPATQSLVGRNLFDAFDLRRPSGVLAMADLRLQAGEKLQLSLRGVERSLPLRGLAQNLNNGGGMIVNLSFGIKVVEAVSANALTDGDFAPTDLAVEMMYLVEANTAAMAALGGLAQRLENDKQTAQAMALTDTLTGLRNRRALSMETEVLTRTHTHFALMHIDLDFFKAVNDTYGHAAGDHVLKEVAKVLQRETRAEDTVARVGGDEFVVVFPDMVDTAGLEAVAYRIIEELTVPILFDGHNCRISASIGIALSNQYVQPDPKQMQTDADEALYASKRAGRGQARVFNPAEEDRRRA
jgi:diguanylate cyclase (GGDEF)-like protein